LSYAELREKLRRRFGSEDQQEKFQAELRSRRRRRGETLAELYHDVRRVMTMAYPGEGASTLCEHIAKDYFIAALNDRELELKIREREPRDLESALKQAVRLEAYEKAVDDKNEQGRSSGGRARDEEGLARKVSQLERKLEQAGATKAVVSERVEKYPPMDGRKYRASPGRTKNSARRLDACASWRNKERRRVFQRSRTDCPHRAASTSSDSKTDTSQVFLLRRTGSFRQGMQQEEATASAGRR